MIIVVIAQNYLHDLHQTQAVDEVQKSPYFTTIINISPIEGFRGKGYLKVSNRTIKRITALIFES